MGILAGIAVLAGAGSFALFGAGGPSTVQAGEQHGKPAQPTAHAIFYRVQDVAQLKQLAPTVVVAEVTGVEKGKTLTFDQDESVRAKRSPALPSQDVRLRVVERLSGEIEDEPVWWFPLAPGGLQIDDSPSPKVGERYVLFLAREPLVEGRWAVPAIDGRLRLDEAGAVTPMLGNGVGAQLAQSGLAKIQEAVR